MSVNTWQLVVGVRGIIGIPINRDAVWKRYIYRDTVLSYRFTRESSLVSVKVNDNCQQRSGECVGRMKITRL